MPPDRRGPGGHGHGTARRARCGRRPWRR